MAQVTIPRWSLYAGVIVLVAALAFSLGGFYTARGDNHDQTYYGCLFAGSLSQVNTNAPPANCGRGTQVQWNAQGIQGLPGVDGVDGIDGVSGWEKTTTETEFTDFTSPDPLDYQTIVSCTAGKKPLGGGATVGWFDNSGFLGGGFIAQDGPLGSDNGWFARAEQPTSAAVTTMRVTVNVICATVN